MRKIELKNAMSQDDKDKLAQFCATIVDRGFVPRSKLEEEFGAGFASQAIAILFRTHRLLREVNRKGDDGEQILGYEWGDRRFSKSQAKKLEESGLEFVLQFEKKTRPRYQDFEVVRTRCRWTSPVLGAMPKTDEKTEKLVFDRDEEDNVYLPAYCLRAMMKTALPLLGKEASIAYRIQFSSVRVENPKIDIMTRPVVSQNTGLGLKHHEAMPAGTEFTVEAMVPTSALSIEEYVRALAIAGKYVRFSPSRSQGFGEFSVLNK